MSAMRVSLPEITDYPAHLRRMWEKHLAPREPDAPTVISLFAGGGGSSLGYSMAGFKELLAVEWDDSAVRTFRANFPGVPVYHGDIATLSVEQALDMAGIRPGELDVLDGSPPCQGFSTAGKRILDDPRNQLFREFVRLLRGFRPKVFVMENVSGMVKGKMKLLFAEIMRELRASGYRVKARLLNAMWFGVPQSRERVIFIGVREDLGVEPSHPRPEWQPVACADAVVGADTSGAPELTDRYGKLWPLVPWDGNAADVLGNGKGFNNCRKPHPRKPAPTLPKEQTGRGFATVVHWAEPRALSIGEAKRLQSFPDEFVLTGTYREQWAIIGNSVPPLMMEAIARHIREHILKWRKRS